MRTLYFLLFSFCLPSIAFSEYGFDKLRCQGKLIERGMSLYEVKKLCGEPLFEKEDKNDYRTFVYMTYKNGPSSHYYLLFRNDSLEASRAEMNQHGEYIWQNPNTIRNR
ncbi:Protein of uncharacterised function (DUF2845) (plasmid) [Legionella adelaidensis]|uniref:Protein of uncharacterized function (DUF2845) n=1 Tax=Legionella adelaidensis TaxID=45056 RepID=A0A0W0R2K0_9GAMM|nr:DUF2845 domain-containing protein [Legionella adelaidensis]KTC65328.1 hypothetical protein Lade_1350 [Legionella adelaidensis]VEH86021.1 Protein of uncharacterised function (DUF2845) [Legionella adelaidensis]